MSLNEFLSSIIAGVKDFSVANLQHIILLTLAATVGLCIAWFGYRFVIRKVQKALHKGSL